MFTPSASSQLPNASKRSSLPVTPKTPRDSTSRESTSVFGDASTPGHRAFHRLRARSLRAATASHQERHKRLHRHLTKGFFGEDLPVSTEEEMDMIARMLHVRMAEVIPDPTARGWYKMFVWMDDDCSGKLAFWELEDMIRNELMVSARQFPDEQLQALWRALDTDESGLITAGEFGAFMKRGMMVRDKQAEWRAKYAKMIRHRGDMRREERRKALEEKRRLEQEDIDRKRGMASTSHDVSWGFLPSPTKPGWRSPRAIMF
eukprot:TRINITY_DN98548_c0_g1_i1.p1 TRINITY_DN98548_c0_g1~~TRINITY_DN98548_c0_g1_i1.p1  ORF type:complete len:261 (-),score=42.52 TRINITY_DN98548_c0_g1_i1:10-792(-)